MPKNTPILNQPIKSRESLIERILSPYTTNLGNCGVAMVKAAREVSK